MPGAALAWPTDAEWIPIPRNSAPVEDPNSDSNGSRNVVSEPGKAALFMYNDGVNIMFRFRLDDSPAGTGGQGLFKSFGWGVELDTDGNLDTYEWLLLLDGISKSEPITLQQNTVQGTLGDPGDNTELTVATIPPTGNHRILLADTSINGDVDYFLDIQFPWDTMKTATGLTDSSVIRVFGGSSSSANSLTESGADLICDPVLTCDLTNGFSDPLTPFGTVPATGSVQFVAALDGTGDVTEAAAGDTLFLRVDDGDLNISNATAETLTVTVTSTTGDSETVTLTETGPDTGIFTGSLTSVDSASPLPEDGTLQTIDSDTVTAVYVDAIDADGNTAQSRNDSLSIVNAQPLLELIKSVDNATALPGETLTYSLRVNNLGDGQATTVLVSDTVPDFTTYLAGSLRLGGPTDAYADATVLTDAAGDDAGEVSGTSIFFRLDSLLADDSVPNSGGDERVLFFQVIVN